MVCFTPSQSQLDYATAEKREKNNCAATKMLCAKKGSLSSYVSRRAGSELLMAERKHLIAIWKTPNEAAAWYAKLLHALHVWHSSALDCQSCFLMSLLFIFLLTTFLNHSWGLPWYSDCGAPFSAVSSGAILAFINSANMPNSYQTFWDKLISLRWQSGYL